MFNSFLIKIRAKEDGEINNVAESLYDSLCQIINKTEYELKDKNVYKSFCVSGFLKEKIYFAKIEKDKNYFFRISTLRKEVFALFTSFLFRKRMRKDSFIVSNINFKVLDVIYSPDRSKWVNIFSKNDIERILHDDLDVKNIRITFIRPTVFKVGSRFFCEVNPELIFSNLVNKFIKYSGYKIQDSYLKELFRTNIRIINIEKKKIKINRFYTEGFIGNIDIDLLDLQEESKKLVYVLLNFAFYSGVGYKTEIGYGQIIVENII